MILKIDDLISVKGGGKAPPMPSGMPGGMGGMGGMGMGGMPY
jgi:hypothetical protein